MITLSFHFKSQYETTTSSTEKNEDVAVLSCQTKSSSQVVPDCIKPNIPGVLTLILSQPQ